MNKVLQRSLSRSPWWVVALTLLGAFGLIFAMMGIGIVAQQFVPEWIALAAMAVVFVAGLGGLTAGLLFLTNFVRDRELRWLRRLPWAFDIDRYTKALSMERMRSKARLDLVFLDPVPEDAHHDLEELVKRVPGVREAAFTAKGHLRIRSLELETWFTGGSSSSGGSRPSYYSNAEVHAWVRTVSDRAIRAIHAKHALERVDFGVS